MSFFISQGFLRGRERQTTGGTANVFFEDELAVTSIGQTFFTLSKSYKSGGLAALTLNGVGYALDTNYTLSDKTLIWLNTPFVLAVGDKITVAYEFV